MPKPKKVGVAETKAGRPTKKTDELIDKILERVALGENNVTICRDPEMPSRSTLHDWLAKDKSFSDKYAQAKNFGGDVVAQSLIELASQPINYDGKNPNAEVQHRRLQIDTLKFLLGKWYPKKYGDKLDVTSEQKPLTGFEIKGLNGDKL